MLKDQKIYNNKIQTDRKNESIENCIPCPRILIKNKVKVSFFYLLVPGRKPIFS